MASAESAMAENCVEHRSTVTGAFSTENRSTAISSSCDSNAGLVMVPPCRVCGGKASGFHYGVDTCEGCKTFFRRAPSRKAFVCRKRSGTCVIKPNHRQNCAYCRLKKCKEVGMSRECIKTGRYTYEKRTENIVEIKKLELQRKITAEGELVTSVDTREQDMDRLIDKLSAIYTNSLRHDPDFFNSIRLGEMKYLEQREMEEQLYGKRHPLRREEYRAVYKETGIDADGRKTIIAKVLQALERNVVLLLAFFQAIPGFTSLLLKDQKQLMQASSPHRLFLFYKWFNPELKLFSYPQSNGLVLSAEDVGMFLENPDRPNFWLMLKKLQQLDLTEQESVMAAALCCLCSEAELSEEGRRIASQAAEYIAETLSYLIAKNHEPEDLTYAKIISIMIFQKEYSTITFKAQQHFLEDSDGLQVPELLKECMCRTM